MTAFLQAPDDLLGTAYEELDFIEGELMDATGEPYTERALDWIEKGEWLSLAKKVGVEKVLFIDNNPVVVFSRSITSDQHELRRLYNRIWCMARPQLLFLACPGELQVLDLTRPPVKPQETLANQGRVLDVAKSTAEVQSVLQAYSRSRIETGRLFEDKRFEATPHRADEALIRDLKTVRRRLIEAGLRPEHAHALIGRSIFVRYLEDRHILTRDYFTQIAAKQSQWLALLNTPPQRPDLNPDMEHLLYPRVLSNKEFTYALFDRLFEDFNGDMFPSDEDERQQVTQTHLTLLQEFLRGDIGPQQSLFFFAYRFDIIPIELISSIYEEFYNTQIGEDRNQGSHYTPGALVEFVLSQALTPERLATQPRILDPACGSGIFLVEAFRRIVRHQVTLQNGRPLNREQLLRILREQLCGIEINPEAIRVAAFSLYLAFLHYQDPPDIQRNKRLPNLKYELTAEKDTQNQFDILVAANSFTIGSSLLDPDVRNRFTGPCVDIVVGNPPWGYPGRNHPEGQASAQEALLWCQERGRPVGDKELSQAFIYRTLDFLREGGCAGLLVSTGVFFKAHENSRAFREKWLSSATLIQVVNFAHVREVFFSGSRRGTDAIAPFASVIFRKGRPTSNDHMIEYWSAKNTPLVNKLEAVVLSRTDRKLLPQASVYAEDTLWKIYWWGNHRDEALLQKLKLNTRLEQYPKLILTSGSGYKAGNEEDADWLKEFSELPTDDLVRYGELDFTRCNTVPDRVARRRERALFEGLRLLIKHGPAQSGNRNGKIIARLDNRRFCFRHSIYSFRFCEDITWQATVVLGILWSSLARYYFFLTASSWGTWQHKISLQEVRDFPIRLSHKDSSVIERIRDIVETLRKEPENLGGLFGVIDRQAYRQDRMALERELDEAVFDLYDLTEPERDLVRDLCNYGLDLFYRHVSSDAVKPIEHIREVSETGTRKDLPTAYNRRLGLEPYLYAFLSSWNSFLEPEGELSWQVIRSVKNISLLAVVFTAHTKGMTPQLPSSSVSETWDHVLEEVAKASPQAYHTSKIYSDGLVRAISGASIIIIKRNERRLWTPSMAREDAEATLLLAIQSRESMQEAER